MGNVTQGHCRYCGAERTFEPRQHDAQKQFANDLFALRNALREQEEVTT